MKVYAVELWVIQNMYQDTLEEYNLHLSLKDAQDSCAMDGIGYAMNDHEYIRSMDKYGVCRRIVVHDLGE